MGRINYGPYLKDAKGITEGVRLGFQFLFDWTVRPLPLADLARLSYDRRQSASQEGPLFCRGTFRAEACADTFIDMQGWTKGVVFINGFNLGRYWEQGPQRTLYVPAPLLRTGDNGKSSFRYAPNTGVHSRLDRCANTGFPCKRYEEELAMSEEMKEAVHEVENGVHNYSSETDWVKPENPVTLERLEWFKDQKLALMMHWGHILRSAWLNRGF